LIRFLTGVGLSLFFHTLTPGQLLTGRRKLSKITGISQGSIDRILKCFESAHMIQQNVLKKYRVITITRWEFFQSQDNREFTGGPMMSQSRADHGPIVSTYKKDKNEKNENTQRASHSRSSEQKEIQRTRQ